MKIKIVSDGSSFGTKITDENGNPIEGVTGVTWKCNAKESATATIELIGVPVEIIGEGKTE